MTTTRKTGSAATIASAGSMARVLVCTLVVASCGTAVRPMPTPAPPTIPPAVIPVVVEPKVESWIMPALLPRTRYVSEVSTTLERDSARTVLQERVETRGIVSLQGRRDTLGAFRGNGVVDSFTVRGLERVLTPNQGERPSGQPVPLVPAPPMSVQFEAVLDARILRVSTRPPLANECDKAESGATAMVRDAVVRLPKTLAVGTAWQDSSITFQCRLSIPITSHTAARYVVERADQVDNRMELVVRKNSTAEFSGEVRSTWRTMTLNATGSSTQTFRVDASSGVVQSVEGEGQLTVRLTDSSRRDGSGTQEVRQKTISRIRIRP